MSTEQTAPTSIQRVKDVFAQEGWEYTEVNEVVLRTGFAGIGLEINYIEPTVNVVSTVAVDELTTERYGEVRDWVEQYNFTKAFPSVTALKDEDRGIAAFGATYAIPGYWEYTDAQFDSHVRTGIQGVVAASRDFLATFAPQVLEYLDNQAQS